MDKHEQLERLYDLYDASENKKEKIAILERIISLDPDDIDSMHRIVSLLPASQRFYALLELKEKAKEIVYRIIDESDDIYGCHETRPYLFILFDILLEYEKRNDFKNAYKTMQEILKVNDGDNCGVRYHLAAYYIGQNKLEELENLLTVYGDFGVALRFSQIYLNEVKNSNNDHFETLFDEFPYLYALLTKEIKINKSELELMHEEYDYYAPGGFYEQVETYRLIKKFINKDVEDRIKHILFPKRYVLHSELEDSLPNITKQVLFAYMTSIDCSYNSFLKDLEWNRISKEEFESCLDVFEKFDILRVRGNESHKEVVSCEALYFVSDFLVELDEEKNRHMRDISYRVKMYKRYKR